MYMLRVIFLVITLVTFRHCQIFDDQYDCTFEDLQPCLWEHNTSIPTGFEVWSGEELESFFKSKDPNSKEEFDDGDGHIFGHFLMANLNNVSGPAVHIWSPQLKDTFKDCKLNFRLKMVNMTKGFVRCIIEGENNLVWISDEINGDNANKWENITFPVGRVTQSFRIYIEFVPSTEKPSRVFVDNLQLTDCLLTPPARRRCTEETFNCAPMSAHYKDYCINKTQVCDMIANCLNGADEMQNCEKVPRFGRCSFETGWCGWRRSPNSQFDWTLKKAVGQNRRYLGPPIDHTFLNESGHFLHADLKDERLSELGASAILVSSVFNPPPPAVGNPKSKFYGACSFRFNYFQFGIFSGSVSVSVRELRPKGTTNTVLWIGYGSSTKTEKWYKESVTVPPIISHRYFFVLEARKGFGGTGDVAIDDVTMSPECFGLNIPKPELGDYNYYHHNKHKSNKTEQKPHRVHKEFAKATTYKFTTCGASGRFGPTPDNCSQAYEHTSVSDVTVLEEDSNKGIQRWVVPKDGSYTLIVKGAGGGGGYDQTGQTRGAVVTGIAELKKGQVLYLMVGQKGQGGCGRITPLFEGTECGPHFDDSLEGYPSDYIKDTDVSDDGGGGGGASMIYTVDFLGRKVPLVVAGGGGGSAGGVIFKEDGKQHGQGIGKNRPAKADTDAGNFTTGAGGGWEVNKKLPQKITMGQALSEGGVGGLACDGPEKTYGAGGFGGGGGGCYTGGGGGGYTGGDASRARRNGRGGYSYVASSVSEVFISAGRNGGDGLIEIIPAIDKGCGCEYKCAISNYTKANVKCLCPEYAELNSDGRTCNYMIFTPLLSQQLQIATMTVVGLILFCVPGFLGWRAFSINMLRKVYRRKRLLFFASRGARAKSAAARRTRPNILTVLNPNYKESFVFSHQNTKNLFEIPREQIRILNFENPRSPIGRGAFAEVFKGYYKREITDSIEIPVAIKTLPLDWSVQSEMDFVMEAVLMSHFRHPNIVNMMGVCFNDQPRLIVLEFLAGGDLRHFLHRERPRVNRKSNLVFKDLVLCAADVIRGLEYLHSKHFVHRDLAARNCLLTTGGSGRITKIADFGMARDIYTLTERADYFDNEGKLMLPVKWMPPESFKDGKFTYKCDIWAFGVLFWEILTFGAVPYGNLSNMAAMEFVRQGGRLEKPVQCPDKLYQIMLECWDPDMEKRPPAHVISARLQKILDSGELDDIPLEPSPTYGCPDEETDSEPDVYDADFLEEPEKPPVKTLTQKILSFFGRRTKTETEQGTKTETEQEAETEQGAETELGTEMEQGTETQAETKTKTQKSSKWRFGFGLWRGRRQQPQEQQQPEEQQQAEQPARAPVEPRPQPMSQSRAQPSTRSTGQPRTQQPQRQQRQQPTPKSKQTPAMQEMTVLGPQARSLLKSRGTQPPLKRQSAISESTFEENTTRIVRKNIVVRPPPSSDERRRTTFTTFHGDQAETSFIDIREEFGEPPDNAWGYDPNIFGPPQGSEPPCKEEIEMDQFDSPRYRRKKTRHDIETGKLYKEELDSPPYRKKTRADGRASSMTADWEKAEGTSYRTRTRADGKQPTTAADSKEPDRSTYRSRAGDVVIPIMKDDWKEPDGATYRRKTRHDVEEPLSGAELNRMTQDKPDRKVDNRGAFARELASFALETELGLKRSSHGFHLTNLSMEEMPLPSLPKLGDDGEPLRRSLSYNAIYNETEVIDSPEHIPPPKVFITGPDESDDDDDNGDMEEKHEVLEPIVIVKEPPSKVSKGVTLKPDTLKVAPAGAFLKPKPAPKPRLMKKEPVYASLIFPKDEETTEHPKTRRY